MQVLSLFPARLVWRGLTMLRFAVPAAGDNQRMIGRCRGLVDGIVGALSAHPRVAAVQEAACSLAANVSLYVDKHARRNDVVTLVKSAAVAFADSDGVSTAARRALKLLDGKPWAALSCPLAAERALTPVVNAVRAARSGQGVAPAMMLGGPVSPVPGRGRTYASPRHGMVPHRSPVAGAASSLSGRGRLSALGGPRSISDKARGRASTDGARRLGTAHCVSCPAPNHVLSCALCWRRHATSPAAWGLCSPQSLVGGLALCRQGHRAAAR